MRSIKLVTMLAIALLATSVGCKDRGGVPSEGTRPADTGSEEQDAYVLMLKGAVVVKPAVGADFAAQVGQGLYRSDTLRTGPNAYVVLKLKNNYLVRLDEALTLAVGDIALINAGTTDRDFRDQLDHLLNDDKTTVADREGVYQRIAGWRSERRAMETVAAAPPAVAQVASAEEEKGDKDGEAEPPPPQPVESMRAQRPAPTPAWAAEQRSLENADTDQTVGRKKDEAPHLAPKGGGAAGSAAPAAAAEPDVAAEVTAADLMPPAGTEPEYTIAQLKQKLQSCLSTWVADEALPLGNQKITVRWSWKDAALVRVWLEGALPTPACVREEVQTFLTATRAADGEGSMEVVLP